MDGGLAKFRPAYRDPEKVFQSVLWFKAAGYCYFQGEAADWLDKTVNVPTVNSLTLGEWIAEFDRLKKVNAEIMGAVRVEGAEPETVHSPKMKSLQQIGE